MTARTYGQYCGFSRALEMLGERWGLLIIRDLLVGPKRYTDLQRGLPGIPSNILSARLKELEASGVVRRRLLPRPENAVVYELTSYGRELDDIVIRLGRWGAKSLGDPGPDEVVTVDSIISAFRSTFRSEHARGVHASFEVHAAPGIIVHAIVDDGALVVAEGALPGADVSVEAGPALRPLMARELTPKDALATGAVRVTGNRKLLTTFVHVFRLEPKPVESATA